MALFLPIIPHLSTFFQTEMSSSCLWDGHFFYRSLTVRLEIEKVLKTWLLTTCPGQQVMGVLRPLFLSASRITNYLRSSLTLSMLILWILLLLVWSLRVGIWATRVDFCTLWNFVFQMILTYSNIVLIRLFRDVSWNMRLGVSCLSIMTKSVKDTLLEKRQRLRFFSMGFTCLLWLKMPMSTIRDALDVSS